MIDLEKIKADWDYDSIHPIWGIVKELVEELEPARAALTEIRRSSEYPYSGEVDHALWSIGMERQ